MWKILGIGGLLLAAIAGAVVVAWLRGELEEEELDDDGGWDMIEEASWREELDGDSVAMEEGPSDVAIDGRDSRPA